VKELAGAILMTVEPLFEGKAVPIFRLEESPTYSILKIEESVFYV
jgi:hypothetical protein